MWISSCFLSIAVHMKVLFKKQASYILTYIYVFSYFYFLWLRNLYQNWSSLREGFKGFLTFKSTTTLTWVHRECWYSLGLSLLLPKSSGHKAEVGMSQSIGGFPAENAMRLAWACPSDQFVPSYLKGDTMLPQRTLSWIYLFWPLNRTLHTMQFYHTTRDVWLNLN